MSNDPPKKGICNNVRTDTYVRFITNSFISLELLARRVCYENRFLNRCLKLYSANFYDNLYYFRFKRCFQIILFTYLLLFRLWKLPLWQNIILTVKGCHLVYFITILYTHWSLMFKKRKPRAMLVSGWYCVACICYNY